MRRVLFIVVAAVLAIGWGAGPANANGAVGLEVYPNGSGTVHEYGTSSAGFYLHAHGTDVRDVTVRIDLAVASRVTVTLSQSGCSRSGSSITCKFARIPSETAQSIDIYAQAKEGAATGSGGSITAHVLAATPTSAYSTTVQLNLTVERPPTANVSGVSDNTYHYLHVGDTLDALVTVRNRGPAAAPQVVLTKPKASGFSFVRWLNCDPSGDQSCVTSLAAGASRRVGARLKLTSSKPEEPGVLFSVEGVIDPVFGDNYVGFIICVYESGRCTRDLPGSASNTFANPKPGQTTDHEPARTGGAATSPSRATSTPTSTAVAPAAASAAPTATNAPTTTSPAPAAAPAVATKAAALADDDPWRGVFLGVLLPALVLLAGVGTWRARDRTKRREI
jgi:uncharacterized repeat protein (TIGR01451 family)